MHIKITLLIIGSLLFHNSFAQKNYIPASIITTTKDTLNGFIDYRNWSINPDRISFVDVPDAQPTTYKPTDLLSFQVNSERYISAIVETEISPRDTKKLNSSPDLKIRMDTAFLRTLIRGERSLHYYKNNLGVDCYYIQANQEFQLLKYKKYLKSNNSKEVIAENKQYIGQLNEYLSQCSPGIKSIRGTSYKTTGLLKLFQAYYDCSRVAPEYLVKKEKMQTDFGVLAGVSLTSLEFNSEGFKHLAGANFPTSSNFSGGLFLNLIIPRSQGKWSIYNELLFTSYSVAGSYIEENFATSYTEYTTEIARSYLKLNNMVRFKYPVGGIFLYINLGLSNGFAIHEEDYVFTQTVRNGEVYSEGEMPMIDSRKYEQGVIVGIGIQMKRISLDVRHEKSNGISEYSNLGSPVKRLYFLLGYQF